MRSDAGYTATEALAALAIVGLAVGGLQTGMQTLGRSQDGFCQLKLSVAVSLTG